jgi:putative SOS response-associated peptidase YedK
MRVMAGLWDEWKSERIRSWTIITCPPNAVAGTLHDRMLVILAASDWAKWLGEEAATPEERKALLVPCPDEAVRIWPVNRTKIGNVRNKGAEIVQPEPASPL